jgi:hydroxyquinol 1,2-dioxygenase
MGTSVAPTFSEATSVEVVVGRLLECRNGPLPRFLTSMIEVLHDVARKTRPTVSEWRALVDFLTEVGNANDERRQEWMLLSDLLGITALIEDMNLRRPHGATPKPARGPFYRGGAKHLASGANICLDGIGEPLSVTGRICDLDGCPVAGATVETWQANGQGFCENQQPDLAPDFNLRGVFTTDRDGRFHYLTIKPAGYSVPEDGPVGQMLGKIGYPLPRPAHLHFNVEARGFETLTTQIFDSADPFLSEDALFSVRSELIAEFQRESAIGWSLHFTFVLARARHGRGAA